MQKFKHLFFLFLGLCLFTEAFADDFVKDPALITQLTNSQIRIILLRQAEAIDNSEGIISSSSTPGYYLTPQGIIQTANLINTFKTEGITHIYTSPIYRCLQTTQMIGIGLEIADNNLIIDSRLSVQDFGNYEGMGFSSYQDLFGSNANMLEATPLSAESGLSVYQRTQDFLMDIATSQNNATILIVTHGFNFCHIRKLLTGYFGSLPAVGTYEVYDYSFPQNSKL